jgi:DNA primase
LGLIPDETLRRIRDTADIVALVGRHVSLKRAGRNYKGLCPFHEEKTPSFNVNPERGTYYCFGCHEGGDVLSFVMKVENLSFREAAQALARETGIEIPETHTAAPGAGERLYAAVETAWARYRAALEAPGNPAAAYLAERGLDPETIEQFGLGYAPDRWDTLTGFLRQKGIPPELGERAGLLAPRDSGGFYDRLRGRVVFPIRDVHGRAVAFGGRALAPDQQPKYLNTPESPIFRKREAFYGFPEALEPIRKADRAVVVEGYFDLIALHRAGIRESVATCGTALTEAHARNLRRRTRQVVLLFDGDDAGRAAATRALEVLLPVGLRVRTASLPPRDDPDSYLAREGAEALRRLVDAAPPALDAVIREATRGGCRTPWEKSDAVTAVAPLLALVQAPVERGELCAQLALAVGTEPRHVEAAVRAAARGEEVRDALPVAPRLEGADERKLRRLAHSLVEHPHLAGRIEPDEFSLLVPRLPLSELIAALIEAAGEDRRVDLEELGGRVSDDARSLLFALTAEELAIDEDAAARTVEDTLAWLRRRHAREQQRALTQRLLEPGADAAAVLREKRDRLTPPDAAAAPPGPRLHESGAPGG